VTSQQPTGTAAFCGKMIMKSLEKTDNRNGYFGLCPTCGQTDGYLNIERDHYFVCHEHKLCWIAGSNLFSAWREDFARSLEYRFIAS
jgi:hypothetical protein